MGASSSSFHKKIVSKLEICQAHSGKEKNCLLCSANVELFSESTSWDECMDVNFMDLLMRISDDQFCAKVVCTEGVPGSKAFSLGTSLIDEIPSAKV